jgi:hypothetical protein
MPKLTDHQRKNIIAAVANGESKRSIGRRYGVSDMTVRRICLDDPEMSHKVAQKKAENIASVLAHMESQKTAVCEVIDSLLAHIADSRNLDAATLPQLATTLGILIDKYTANEVKTPHGVDNNLFDAIVGNAGEDMETDDIPELEQEAATGDDVVEPSKV